MNMLQAEWFPHNFLYPSSAPQNLSRLLTKGCAKKAVRYIHDIFIYIQALQFGNPGDFRPNVPAYFLSGTGASFGIHRYRYQEGRPGLKSCIVEKGTSHNRRISLYVYRFIRLLNTKRFQLYRARIMCCRVIMLTWFVYLLIASVFHGVPKNFSRPSAGCCTA